jgi:hypothetical protein
MTVQSLVILLRCPSLLLPKGSLHVRIQSASRLGRTSAPMRCGNLKLEREAG